MTTIAAYRDVSDDGSYAQSVSMSCDSRATIGATKYTMSTQEPAKIFRHRDTLIGMSGHSQYAAHVRKAIISRNCPDIHTVDDVYTLHNDIIKPYLKDVDYDCEKEGHSVGELLIASLKCIILMCGDGSVVVQDRYNAIGSGCEFALGAMSVVRHDHCKESYNYTISAVNAAIKFDLYSGGPVNTLTLPE